MTAPRLFVFGLGYTAGVLARKLAGEGWRIAGTCQSEETRAALEAQGYEAFVFDRAHPLPDAKAALKGTTHLLLSVPPDRQGDPVQAVHGMDIAELISLEWAGYLSTTGVYGDSGGEWVSEASLLRPNSERAKRRVEAEKGWLNLYRQYGVPLHVFRLPGIYGPGRSAIDQLRAGEAKRLDKPGHLFGRIHVADIAGVLRASMATMNPGAVYNVCDDEPAEPQEVIRYAAELLGIEPPPLLPFETAELSEMARSFWADNRRVKNERIKSKLGYTLTYPSYREGLKAQAGEE